MAKRLEWGQRLAAQATLGTSLERLEQRFPDRFAGGWFEHAPAFRAVARSRGQRDRRRRRLLQARPHDGDMTILSGARSTFFDRFHGVADGDSPVRERVGAQPAAVDERSEQPFPGHLLEAAARLAERGPALGAPT